MTRHYLYLFFIGAVLALILAKGAEWILEAVR